MGHQMTFELTHRGLLVELADYYTTGGALNQYSVCLSEEKVYLTIKVGKKFYHRIDDSI